MTSYTLETEYAGRMTVKTWTSGSVMHAACDRNTNVFGDAFMACGHDEARRRAVWRLAVQWAQRDGWVRLV